MPADLESFRYVVSELGSPVHMRIEHKPDGWKEVEFSDAVGCSVIAEYRHRVLCGFIFNFRRLYEKPKAQPAG